MNPQVRRFLPFLNWAREINAVTLRQDLVAGLTVSLVLIPQSMAYAQLAGLPVHYGLYAAFLPPIIAALFGSSRQLATGPVALASLLTAAALGPLAAPGSDAYIQLAILLAFVAGLIQLSMGILRLGIIVNFISSPVLQAYTNAAALIIASSQLPYLFGVSAQNDEHLFIYVFRVIRAALTQSHIPTLAMGACALASMLTLRRLAPRIPYVLATVVLATVISRAIGYERVVEASLDRLDNPRLQACIKDLNDRNVAFHNAADESARAEEGWRKDGAGKFSSPYRSEFDAATLRYVMARDRLDAQKQLVSSLRFDIQESPSGRRVVLKDGADSLIGRKADWKLQFDELPLAPGRLVFTTGGAVVGDIPRGLPRFSVPRLNPSAIAPLLSMALVISILGFMEAITISKAMAARTGQRLDPNQELIGQGLAKIAGSLAQSYPTSGSFSRSPVNLAAGAQTGLSSVFAGGAVALTLLFFTPLLYHLPKSVLAAVIMLAVFSLFDVRSFVRAWKIGQGQAPIGAATFLTTLYFAPHLEIGLFVGVSSSLLVYLYRRMRPEVVSLSLHPDGTYRDAARFGLRQCRHIAVIRFDGSLFFADASYLEYKILDRISALPDLRVVILAGEAINDLDATGEDVLSRQVRQMRAAGRDIAFCGLHSHVTDIMKKTGLYDQIGEDRIFRTLPAALEALHGTAHRDSEEIECPLRSVCYSTAPRTGGR